MGLLQQGDEEMTLRQIIHKYIWRDRATVNAIRDR